MAKLEFMSPEAGQHFKKVVAHSIEHDTFFNKRGLLDRLTYLRNYGDEGKDHVRSEGGAISQWRVLLGFGYSETEVNIIWQTRTYVRQAGKLDDECWTAWENFLVGGLIGHSDGTWGTHT